MTIAQIQGAPAPQGEMNRSPNPLQPLVDRVGNALEALRQIQEPVSLANGAIANFLQNRTAEQLVNAQEAIGLIANKGEPATELGRAAESLKKVNAIAMAQIHHLKFKPREIPEEAPMVFDLADIAPENPQFPICLNPLVQRIMKVIEEVQRTHNSQGAMPDWMENEAIASFKENPTAETLIEERVQEAIRAMAKRQEEVNESLPKFTYSSLKEANQNAMQWIRYFSNQGDEPADVKEALIANLKNLAQIFSKLLTDSGFDHLFTTKGGWNREAIKRFVDTPTLEEFSREERYFCTLESRFFGPNFSYHAHLETALLTKFYRRLDTKDFQTIVPADYKRMRYGDVEAALALWDEVQARKSEQPVLDHPVPIPADKEKVDNPYNDGIEGEPKTDAEKEIRRAQPLRVKGEISQLCQSIQDRLRILQKLGNEVVKQDPTILLFMQSNTEENLKAAQAAITALIADNPAGLPTIQDLRDKKEYGKVYTDPHYTIDSLRRLNDAAVAWSRFSKQEGPLPPPQIEADLDLIANIEEIERMNDKSNEPEESSWWSTLSSWLGGFWKWITCSG